jgi:type 1 fimbriae regulatory protein FimE
MPYNCAIKVCRKHSRRGHRDATMILVAYRHGLRASEVCDLQWHEIELSEGRMHVNYCLLHSG